MKNKNKIKLNSNPIARKDLTITSRSMRFTWGLFAYEVILATIFLIAFSTMTRSAGRYAVNNAETYQNFVAMFPIISIAELCIVALIIPVMTAGAICGEKERQTFDIMMTTQVRPFRIVTGKMMSAVVKIGMYVVCSIPIMAVGFTIGGISWWALFVFLLLTIVLAVFESAVGVFCSSVCKKSITSTIMSFIIIGVIYLMTYVPLIIAALFSFGAGYYASPGKLFYSLALLLLLLNPTMMYAEFYTGILAGESLVGLLDESDVLPFMTIFMKTPVWIILSVVCMLVLSYIFMRMAAYQIDPLHGSGSTKPAGKKNGEEKQNNEKE